MGAAIDKRSRRNTTPTWRAAILLAFIQFNEYQVVADTRTSIASQHAPSPISMAPRSEDSKDGAAVLAALANYFYPDPIPGNDEFLHSVAANLGNKAHSMPASDMEAGPASRVAAPAPGRGFSVRSQQVDHRVLPTGAPGPAPGRGFAMRSASQGTGVLPSEPPAMPQGSARATAATAPRSQNPMLSPKPESHKQAPTPGALPATAPQQLVLQNEWFGAPTPGDILAMELSLARELQKSILDALAYRTSRNRQADGVTPPAATNASEPNSGDQRVAVAVSVSGIGPVISIANADGEVDPTLTPGLALLDRRGGSTVHIPVDVTSLPKGAPTAAVSAEGAPSSSGAARHDDRQELPDFAGTPLPQRNMSSAEMQAYLLALSDVAAREKGVGPNPTLTAVELSQELASAVRSVWFPWAVAQAQAPSPGAHPAGFGAVSPVEGVMSSGAPQEPKDSSEDSMPDEDYEDSVEPSQAPPPTTPFPEGAPKSFPRDADAAAPQTIGTHDEETPEPAMNQKALAPAPESSDDLEPETPDPSEGPTQALDPAPPAAGSAAESPAAAPAATSLAMSQKPTLGPSETDIQTPLPGPAPSSSSITPSVANSAALDMSYSTADSSNAPSPSSTSSALSPDHTISAQAPAPETEASSAAPALDDSNDPEKDSSGFAHAITVLDSSSAAGGGDQVESPQASFSSSTTPISPSDAEPKMPDGRSTLGSQGAAAQHVKDAVPSAEGPVAASGERKRGSLTPSEALQLLGLSQLDADRVALAAASGILARRQASSILTRARASAPALTAKPSKGVR